MMSSSFERVQSGMHASSSARRLALPAAPTRPLRASLPVTCGLKKETKKLAKTLKQHRKCLESMLASTATLEASVLAPALHQQQQQQQQLPLQQMQAVLAEINQLQSALSSIRAIQQQAAAKRAERSKSSSSSSSSSHSSGCASDCEDDASSRPSRGGGMVVAAGAMCLEVAAPAIDQDMPDITQSLPPPRPHSSTGRVLVCQGKACMRRGGLQVLQAASHAVSESPGIEVIPCKCLGKCKQGPALRVRTQQQPGCVLLERAQPLEVPQALDALLG